MTATTAAGPLFAELDTMLSERGRLTLDYLRAAALPDGRRRREALDGLHRDLTRTAALVSAAVAGHTELPSTAAADHATTPCHGCGAATIARIYGTSWHYLCWLDAGCPTQPVEADEDPAATLVGDPVDEGQAADEADDNQLVDLDGQGDGQGDEQPASPPRRRQHARPRFELDPDEEMRDFARAVRARRPEATDEECAAALYAWHSAVTVKGDPLRFVSSPGYTGVTLYERLTAQHGAMVQPEPLQSERVLELTQSRTTLRVLSFLDFDQTPTPGTDAITEVDVTAQYLAAARSAELGDGEPTEVTADQLAAADLAATFKLPGYVELAAMPELDGLPATARLAFAAVRDGWWLPTPAARYLQHDHGVDLQLAGALMWRPKQHGRRLSVWAATMADGRANLTAAAAGTDGKATAAADALLVLKSVYATFLGGMTRSERHNDKGTLRPDWHDQYVMQAGVNALRALDKALAAGARLAGGMKDSFWFLGPVADAPLQPTGLVFADQPGKWHVHRWAVVDEEIAAAHASGRVGVVRKAITAAHNRRKAS